MNAEKAIMLIFYGQNEDKWCIMMYRAGHDDCDIKNKMLSFSLNFGDKLKT